MLRPSTAPASHSERAAASLALLPSLYPDEVVMKKPEFQYTSATAACAVTLPLAGAIWLIGIPAMSLATLGALGAVVLGSTYVAINTWRNAEATRSIAHVINDTETKVPRE
jgi:hypothetical protein